MNPYYDPVPACRSITDWCSQKIGDLSALRQSPAANGEHGKALDRWEHAFRSLESTAADILASHSAAFYHPAALNQLMHQTRQLDSEFNRFIQAHSAAEPGAVPIGGHTLPPLPYAYNALEPYIDEKTMRLHHDKHHKAYVDGLNKAEKMMEAARKSGDFSLITHWEREAAFHGAGHYLHTIFWNNMRPNGGGEPTGSLRSQIESDFGGFPAFKAHFSAAAAQAEAVGWAILVWSPRARRLEILQAEKHQNLSQWDVIPLLVLDVWEHAYYLKHQNDRKAYIEDWWNVVNWDDVRQRFEQARTLTWAPY